ncbi:MAG: hypothetical protein IJ444_02280 [Kiritimatiellae bacterium]|nr:hypothetical protein [Kiritimatiellia bacterium]
MKAEEAISRLAVHFRIHDDGRPTPFLDEAVAVAMVALTKQIPKKPLLINGRMKCPNCMKNDRSLGYYCDCCGQPIDWSDA